MAMAATRAFLSKLPTLPATTTPRLFSASRLISTPQLLRSRAPLAAAAAARFLAVGTGADKSVAFRCYSTQPTTSSLRDSSPNWSNRPPKETILLDGCDFEHWLVVVEPPPGNPGNPDATREEIIDDYIKTLAKVVGSEQEARMKIYSVSTRHYFAFGALVSEELSYKVKQLPNVRWVLPDSYLNVQAKDYGGEPFINGEAVPYDPKYHEEWVRNNARANDRSRRNDIRPRNSDRSRNFDRRRENSQNFQNNNGPSQNNQGPPQWRANPGAPPNMANTHPQNIEHGNSFQGQPQNSQPNYPQGGPPGPGYQHAVQPGYSGNAPPGPEGVRPGGRPYQRGNGQYQDADVAYQAPQAGNPPYQGGRGHYQGAGAPEAGNPPYQGGPPHNYGPPPPNYAGGPPGYQGQGSNPNIQGPPQSYQGNYQ